jgi:hypothetical protein
MGVGSWCGVVPAEAVEAGPAEWDGQGLYISRVEDEMEIPGWWRGGGDVGFMF